MSSPADEGGWRFRAKWFCGYGFVCAVIAVRRFFSARIAITDSAIAVCIAAAKPVAISGAPPIVVISRVRKADSITVIGSGPTGRAEHKRA